MIFISRAEEPEILRSKGKAKQLALCAAYEQGTGTFSFDSRIYAHETRNSQFESEYRFIFNMLSFFMLSDD